MLRLVLDNGGGRTRKRVVRATTADLFRSGVKVPLVLDVLVARKDQDVFNPPGGVDVVPSSA